jgi:hypothetical protein
VSIVGARPRRSHHPDMPPEGKDMTPDRRGFRSISVVMAGRHRSDPHQWRRPRPEGRGPSTVLLAVLMASGAATGIELGNQFWGLFLVIPCSEVTE